MGEKDNRPVIGITLGDAAGIGPEIVARVASKDYLQQYGKPVIIADKTIWERGMRLGGVQVDYKTVDSIADAVKLAGIELVLLDTHTLDAKNIELGKVSAANGKDEGDRLVECIKYCNEGYLEGFCFAPLNKAALKAGGYDFHSEHELFAHYYGVSKEYGEVNVMNGVWNIRVTSHMPLKDVVGAITVDSIMEAVHLGYKTMKRAGITQPKTAMAAINPHAGDNGTCGTEEIDVLRPAIAAAAKEGIVIDGPFASDTLFIRALNNREYDGVITMYHDQGQIAIKLVGFAHTVTVSAGLPHAITTPSHGTGYEIVGKNKAITSTFEDAYAVACKMAITDRAVK